MNDQPEPNDALKASAIIAASELKEAIREAHGLLKDIKQATREGRALIDDLIAQKVSGKLDEEVVAGLERYQKAITEAIQAATDAVFKRFDTISAELLGETRRARRKHGKSIPELVGEAAAKKRREQNETFPS